MVGLLCLAAVVMAGPLHVSASPSFVTTAGSKLMYQGQAIVLRGVNFNNEPALACCGGPDINLINANQTDYAQAHQLGINSLRWGIDYNWYATNRTQFFTVLDQHMAWAAQYQLWVYLVDYIPPGGSSGGFDQSASKGYCIWSDCATSGQNQTLLNGMWQDIATHYANNPTIVGYDVMNEPAPPADSEWASLASRLYTTITGADPNHFVIIEAPLSNDLSLFSQTARVSYAVHHYAGGNNFPSGQPANTPMIVGEFGGQRIDSTAVTFTSSQIATYNAMGVSWTYFVWREDPQGFGLYVDPAGDFSQPWTAMISATQAGWAGNIEPAASGGPSPSPSPSPTPSPSPSPSPSPGPSGTYDHIFFVIMENHSYSEIIGNSSAPYINSLAGQGALATNYVNPAHPSLPNYMELTAGQIGTCTDDFLTNQCSMPGVGLADRIESSGRTWKGYMESMGPACNLNPGGNYAAHHNPWIYFDNIRNNATRCNSHDVDYSQFSTDLANTSTTPGFVWITPNLISDMHDGTVAQGDTWLSQNIPSILNSPAFKTQRSLLVLTWDEGSADDQVTTIFVGPGVTPGTRDATSYDHYSLLHTIESLWSLPTLTANDAGATVMSGMFGGSGSSPLTASSSASTTMATAPATISFTGSASGGTGPYGYSWTFGDGGTSTSQNPSHAYATGGTYSVNLTVTDAAAHTASASALTITVSPVLSVGDSVSANAGNAPLAVNFTSTPSGGRAPYAYAWTFGDGGTSAAQNPSHTYSGAGTFSANLTVTDANGASAVASSLVITVHGPLSAAASAAPLAGDAPLTVAFTGSGSGGTAPYTYSWTFGDGAGAGTQNPSHAYVAAGTYTATLTVTDAAASTATATATVVVSPTLLASSAANTSRGAGPLPVNFTGSATGGLGPYAYAWTFGDGTSSSSLSPSHTYTVAGTYTATLSVTDANHVRVNATPLTITVTPTLSATSSVLPSTGDAPLAVSFTSTPSGGTAPYSFAWAFGDATSSTVQSPSHTYSGAGTYSATLTVTDALGATATASALTVTVNPPPSAVAAANRTAGDAPAAIGFTGSVIGGTGPYTYAWTFGDGTSSTLQNPGHTYAAMGTYTALLTVTDANSRSASASALTITVSPALIVGDSASANAGNAPLAVNFTSAPSGGRAPYAYAWTFGDGATATAQNPSHTYSAAGTFSANLTVTDANGASAVASSLIITVQGPLSAAASAAPLAGDAPVTVAFTGSGSGGTAPYTYSWTFGDGASGGTQNPSHAYVAAGTYTATLTVTDAAASTATATATVVVSPSLAVSATASPTGGAAPLAVSFTGTSSGGLGPINYVWTFGDGTPSSTAQNPGHTYTTAGTYTVTLNATDANRVSASAAPLTVTVVAPLSGSSASGPRAGDAPFTASFSGTAVGGTPPYTYAWTFGDGAGSSAQNPSHTYTIAGTYTVNLTVTDAGNQTASAGALTITVSPALTLNDSASASRGDSPLAVNFTSTPGGGLPPYTYTWTFGDGGSSTSQSPAHTYTTAGRFSADLTVADANGTTVHATSLTITVSGPLSAASSASSPAGDAPMAVTFTGTPTGGTAPYTFAWSFGDGTSSTSQSPSHTYSGVGTYSATFTVTDATGASAPATALVMTVNTAPSAAASSDRSTVDVPASISFTASVTGGTGPFVYAWAFGDGVVSNLQNPSHTYAIADTYNATLTVTDSSGTTASAAALTIIVSPALSVSVTSSANAGIVPLAAGFTSTPAGGRAPYSYAWSFGDGGSSTSQNPSHTYTAAGIFRAALTVTDGNGATAVAALDMTAIGLLSAGAGASPAVGDAPSTTSFIGSVAGGKAPYSWAWDLGDGTASTVESPSHVYSGPGTYTATLTVSDSSGQVSHASTPVTVYPALLGSSSATPSAGVASLPVTFSAGATGGLAPYTFTWAYGDGAGGSGAAASHSYAQGTFHPTLTVHDSSGGTWSGSVGTITVASPPVIVTSPTPTPSGAQEPTPSPEVPSPAASPSTSPSPTGEPTTSPAHSTAGGSHPGSGGGNSRLQIILLLLGSLFATGLGGTLFRFWIRRRG
jgi:PKD repeat protein